jgi:hypothetical protein
MPRSATAVPHRLDDVIQRQNGVLTRRQALDRGLSPSALRHRLRRGGPWQQILPGVCLTHSGPSTFDQRVTAALLYAGPGAVLTGEVALWLHRVTGRYELRQIHVLVDHGRRKSSTGFVRLMRTRRLPLAVLRRREPCAPVARAVADTCRCRTDFDAVRALVAGAVQQRRCAVEELVTEVVKGPTKDSALLREAVEEAVAGTRSTAEAQARAVIRRARMPEPRWNVDLFHEATGEWLGRPDGWWEEFGVALEIDSREWHLAPDGWEQTMAKHARMTARGVLVVHIPPSLVLRDPREFVKRLTDTLEAGRLRGRIPVRTANGPGVP